MDVFFRQRLPSVRAPGFFCGPPLIISGTPVHTRVSGEFRQTLKKLFRQERKAASEQRQETVLLEDHSALAN
jgi:hypothetical protein